MERFDFFEGHGFKIQPFRVSVLPRAALTLGCAANSNGPARKLNVTGFAMPRRWLSTRNSASRSCPTLGVVHVSSESDLVAGVGLRVQSVGFGVQGLVFRVQGVEFSVEGFGFGVQGFGFRVYGLWFWV